MAGPRRNTGAAIARRARERREAREEREAQREDREENNAGPEESEAEREQRLSSPKETSTVDTIENDIERLKEGSVSRENFAQELVNRSQAYPADSPVGTMYILVAEEFLDESNANSSPEQLIEAYIDGLSKAGRDVPESLRPESRDDIYRDASRIDRHTRTSSIGEADERNIGNFAHVVDNENANNPGVNPLELGYNARADITDRQLHDHRADILEQSINDAERRIEEGRTYEGIDEGFVTEAKTKVQTAINENNFEYDMISGDAGERDAEIRDPNNSSQIITLGEHVDNVTAKIMEDLGIENNPEFQEILAAEILKETDGRMFHDEARLRSSEIEDALDKATREYCKKHGLEFEGIEHAVANNLQNVAGGSRDMIEIQEQREHLENLRNNRPAPTEQEQQAALDAQRAELVERRDELMEEVEGGSTYSGVDEKFAIEAQAKLEQVVTENEYRLDMISGRTGNRDAEIRVDNQIVKLGDHIDALAGEVMRDLGFGTSGDQSQYIQFAEILSDELLKQTDGPLFSGDSTVTDDEMRKALDRTVERFGEIGGVEYEGIEHIIATGLQQSAGGPTDMDAVNELQQEIDALDQPEDGEAPAQPDVNNPVNNPSMIV